MSEVLPLTIFLPAYNEAEVIEEVIDELRATISDCIIIVINDGSSDDTAQRARDKGVKVVSHLINRGAGAACMTGISLAKKCNYDKIVFMDADGQHQAADLLKLEKCMKQTGADVVIGSRFLEKRNGIPKIRRFYNAIANLLTNAFCKQNYTDTQSGFRMLNRKAVHAIVLLQDDFSYCSEMMIQAEKEKLVIKECPIAVRYTDYSMRKGQDFQVGVMTAFHFLWKLIFK